MAISLARSPRRQRTLATRVAIDGVGIHSGERVRLSLGPADADTGTVFVRTDLPPGQGIVRAAWDRVVDTHLSTVVRNAAGATVATVEHLMAALAACGIDNARIELDGPEVPILDGSAACWMALIEAAGTRVLRASRRSIRVLRPVTVRSGDAWAVLEPAAAPGYSVDIDFPDLAIGRQHLDFVPGRAAFRRDIAPARTFGFLRDIASLQSRGLARGGSLDNAIVIGEAGVLNAGGLRFADEFVRHKLLDLIGDLHLAGAPILGQVRAYRPGHGLNNALLRALFADREAWTLEHSASSGCGGFEPRPAQSQPQPTTLGASAPARSARTSTQG